MKSFKVLGLLLTYPKADLVEHFQQLKSVLLTENVLPKKHLKALAATIEKWSDQDVYELQENYVETFDRGRAHSLHLFEHVHGESRDRGQAMIDLADLYATRGLQINKAELPDYLPLFLEYLSLCDIAEAKSLLAEIMHLLTTIATKLRERNNDYHVVFDALQAMTGIKADASLVQQAIAEAAAEDHSLEALDKEWEEAAAFGGDPQTDQSCNTCQVSSQPAQEQTIQWNAGGVK